MAHKTKITKNKLKRHQPPKDEKGYIAWKNERKSFTIFISTEIYVVCIHVYIL